MIFAPLRNKFSDYLQERNLTNSGKASSYVRALDLLSEMLASAPMGFSDCVDIWSKHSISRLQELYALVREQTRLAQASPWNFPGLPPSYLRDGYCSAALRSFQHFLVHHQHAEDLLEIYRRHTGSEDVLAGKLSKEASLPDEFIEELSGQEGRERIQSIKTRINQDVFREIILDVYQNTCCITGIDIPAVNRASHIIPWAESKETRMDPRNGLCLSATYDAAFDRCLISLDEDYRLLVARDIKDHYGSTAVKTHFLARQGQRIELPKRFQPRSDYLEKHRNRGRF